MARRNTNRNENHKSIRIGVFICRCGSNIAEFLDISDVAAFAQTLPDVVLVKENLFFCSEAGLTEIKNAIRENNLNRVVVAACTPLTHEKTFGTACEKAGLNPCLLEFVNIREHCSWVHKAEKKEATDKAKDLLKMGVARAALLETKQKIEAEIKTNAFVIGGGIAGLSAALSIASRGFHVRLAEKEKELGGMVRYLNKLYPGDRDAEKFISGKIKQAGKNKNIEIFTSVEIIKVDGYIGNYLITIKNAKGEQIKFDAGVIIVATGAKVSKSGSFFNHNGKTIVDMLELENKLKHNEIRDYTDFVIILCAGSRNSKRIYCSGVCCMSALKNALLIKENNSFARITVLYTDLQSCEAVNEELLQEAKASGIDFIRYTPTNPPVVQAGEVRVYSDIMGKKIILRSDLTVLATPLIATENNEKLSRLLKVPLDESTFNSEIHTALRPPDFSTYGIYVCGTARRPASVEESINQALDSADRASILLERKFAEVEPIVADVFYEDACSGCGLCVSLCPAQAIKLVKTPKGLKARVIEVACRGCGICAASCYKHAIKMYHFTDEQFKVQISAFLKE